jgi:hypothetical protein
MSALDRRIAKLEATADDGPHGLVWLDLDEAEATAIQRKYGDGPLPKRYGFIRWARDASEAVMDPANQAGDAE